MCMVLPDLTLIDGVPVLAVLFPSRTVGETHEKVDKYLGAGVALVWLLDPHWHTVKVYRPDAQPVLFNAEEELSGEPHLPGFRVAVRQLFAR